MVPSPLSAIIVLFDIYLVNSSKKQHVDSFGHNVLVWKKDNVLDLKKNNLQKVPLLIFMT